VVDCVSECQVPVSEERMFDLMDGIFPFQVLELARVLRIIRPESFAIIVSFWEASRQPLAGVHSESRSFRPRSNRVVWQFPRA
jgi:hypothetical protein